MTIIVTMTIISNNELVIFTNPFLVQNGWRITGIPATMAVPLLNATCINCVIKPVLYTNSITNSFHSEIFRFISS